MKEIIIIFFAIILSYEGYLIGKQQEAGISKVLYIAAIMQAILFSILLGVCTYVHIDRSTVDINDDLLVASMLGLSIIGGLSLPILAFCYSKLRRQR